MRTFIISVYTLSAILMLFYACGGADSNNDSDNIKGQLDSTTVTLYGQVRNIVNKAAIEGVLVRNATNHVTTDSNGKFSFPFSDGSSRVLTFTKTGQKSSQIKFVKLNNLDSLVIFMENKDSNNLTETNYFNGRVSHKIVNKNVGLKNIEVKNISSGVDTSTSKSGWYALTSTADTADIKYEYKYAASGNKGHVEIDIQSAIRDSARIDLVLNDKVTGINIQGDLE